MDPKLFSINLSFIFLCFLRNIEQEKRISEAIDTACLFINGV